MASSLPAIQAFLRLRRPIKVTTPLPIALVRSQLETALSQEIVLKGSFQLTRRYWGNLSSDRLMFYGPRANRQFCFLTRGKLTHNSAQTRLDGQMHLRSQDFYQLVSAVVVVAVLLPVMFRWVGLIFLAIFLGFLYGMVQWHFQHYAREITQLLTDLMTETTPR